MLGQSGMEMTSHDKEHAQDSHPRPSSMNLNATRQVLVPVQLSLPGADPNTQYVVFLPRAVRAAATAAFESPGSTPAACVLPVSSPDGMPSSSVTGDLDSFFDTFDVSSLECTVL
jgi:hypothetical protein